MHSWDNGESDKAPPVLTFLGRWIQTGSAAEHFESYLNGFGLTQLKVMVGPWRGVWATSSINMNAIFMWCWATSQWVYVMFGNRSKKTKKYGNLYVLRDYGRLWDRSQFWSYWSSTNKRTMKPSRWESLSNRQSLKPCRCLQMMRSGVTCVLAALTARHTVTVGKIVEHGHTLEGRCGVECWIE